LIFVCVGSRDYQFNRLLKKIDDLVQSAAITDKIVAQIGKSDYIPKNYEWYRFLDKDVFRKYQSEASLIISHAGTGALIGALKLGKQVIAVPRLAKYGEHIDDHQTQISGVLASEGYLREVIDMEDLEDTIKLCYESPISKKYNKPSNIIPIIENFLDNCM
jgi:UDP-N-acetylglucosamine transferase subunit ALG13